MTKPRNISYDDLFGLIGEWSRKAFGIDFKYRDNQQKTICDIIYSWFNNAPNAVLSAPTGSGKSFIALSIAGVLSEYFDMTGYILVSDLSLIQQYEKDVFKYLPKWGVLRGQQTYTCNENGLPFSLGVCHLMGCKTYHDIESKFQHCVSDCTYIQEREKAISSPVLVCTYAFWLLQQNYVRPESLNPPFEKRDFVICDEGHKLQSIVQQFFSPTFKEDDLDKFKALATLSDTIGNDTIREVKKIRSAIQAETDNEKILEKLKSYVDAISEFGDEAERKKDGLGKKMKDGEALTKHEKTVLYNASFIKDHVTGFSDFVRAIELVGARYLVKNDSSQKDTIVFNCLDESYLMKKYFHDNCRYRMYMSATIGDPAIYAKDISINDADYRYFEMPSVFDYTNSPIFFVNEYKMSYKEKDYSLPYVVKMIEGILTMYKDYRGIIQTGSYAFAQFLLEHLSDNLKKRILIYNNSAEKNEELEKYKFSNNKVLIGPSLVEGLSLDDDLCRFQIIMKVPYPSLGDKFVSAKLNFNQNWYNTSTAISIMQGVGRGVRNEKDWCVTFILDGCFMQLINRVPSMFSEEFKKRIQLITSNTLIK